MPKKDRNFKFSAKVERGGGLYFVRIPAAVSQALGKKGPVPVLAKVGGAVEVLVSLVPIGAGRHRLGLNNRTRAVAKLEEGDTVKVEVTVPEAPIAVPLPDDLVAELRADGVLDTFKALPAGKQNHIVEWIDEAVHDATRRKRIQRALEVAHRKRDKAADKRKAR